MAENARGNRAEMSMFQRHVLSCDVINSANVAAVRAQLKEKLSGSTPQS
jgi:hypothetical protein